MEPLTAVHLSRYNSSHRLASLPHQNIAQSRIDANEDLDAQMGKKKNVKKLSGQQVAATDQPPPAPTQIQMTAKQAPPPAPAAQQQGQGKKKRKKKKKENKIQNEEPLRREHGQVPDFTSSQAGPNEDPTAYFAPGHGHGDGGGEARSGEGSFVGQPLLDALDTIQSAGSEAQASGPGRRTSLVWRPAQGTPIKDGPPPGAPTGPRSAQNVPPSGAPTGPRSWAKPQPQPGPPRGSVPPKSQASSADSTSSRAPPSSQDAHFPPQQSSGSSNDNPHGYNLQNATWDWNTFGSANNAPADPGNGKRSGDWDGSRSVASTSDQYVNTDSTYWPGVHDTMGGFSQQAYNSQQRTYGQAPDGGVWLQQQQPSIVYQSGYYTGYHGSNDTRHIHGHANSFTPRAPTMTSNRGFATKAGKSGGLMSPERTSGSEGSDKVGGVRRSKRLAAKEIAEQEVARSWDKPQGPEQFRSPSPRRKWDRPFRSPSPKAKAVKGPPQPEPTQGYLQKASIPSKQLDYPQTLLVIIDLNGTLVYRPSRKNSSRVVCRPYVQAFLDYLLTNHRAMVWSSARPENVSKMCNQLFDPARRSQLMAEWGRDTLGLTQQQYNEKVQVFKMLRKVWLTADLKQWHPYHYAGHRFGQHNTFLIDDSLLKASSEPHNLVQVDEFEGKPDQMRGDVLRQVVGYLEQAKWMSDVSAWVKAGQRFSADAGWDYAWPAGTVAESQAQAQVLGGGAGSNGGVGVDQGWWRR